MISFKQTGDFSKLTGYLIKTKKKIGLRDLDRYGQEGVKALSSATPIDSGLTASSWYYEIIRTRDSVEIQYKNSNVQNGVPIAIILQYGHSTGTGGWVQGIDYINPAIRPIFDRMASDAWKEVTKV